MAKNAWSHFVSPSELFQGISQRDVQKITSLCTEKRFPRGMRIFSEGDATDCLCILKKGRVKLTSLSDKGRETILHILKPDEVFGELLLSEEKRPFTAITLEDSVVMVISKESFLELLSVAPTLALNFIRLLSKRLATVEKGVAESSHTWSYHRLARVLLQLSEECGEEVPAGTLINVRLTHEDLANLIGTSRETVTAQLNKFTRAGLVKRQARCLIVTKSSLSDFIRSEELRLKEPILVARVLQKTSCSVSLAAFRTPARRRSSSLPGI